MSREHALRRRLHSVQMLSEAVEAMRSLAAHHFRAARSALAPAREYRTGVDRVMAGIPWPEPTTDGERPGWLGVASDLGLCGAYNHAMAQAIIAEASTSREGRIDCVGRRLVSALARAGLRPEQVYEAPVSAAGLTELVLTLAQDLLGLYQRGEVTTLYVVSARFEGVGKFAPVRTQVLPVAPSAPVLGSRLSALGPMEDRTASRSAPTLPSTEDRAPGTASAASPRRSPYVSPSRLAAVAAREFLFITLYELLLDALASEHGVRLMSTEAARRWLDREAATTRRALHTAQRESATQEVLDIAAGARQQLRRTA